MTINGSNNDRFLSVKERRERFESVKNPTAIENSPTAIKTNEVVKQRSNTQPPRPARMIQKPTSTVPAQTQKAEIPTSLSFLSLKQPKPTQTVPAQAQKPEAFTPQSPSSPTQPKPIQTVPAQAQKPKAFTPQTSSSPTQPKPVQTVPTQIQKTETSPSSPFLKLKNAFKFLEKKSILESPFESSTQQPAPDKPAEKPPYTKQPVLIIQARATIEPSKAAQKPPKPPKPEGEFIEGKQTKKFDKVKEIVFHPKLAPRIFGGGGVLEIEEKIMGKAIEYSVLVAPKAYQHWLSSKGHLKEESPHHIVCFLEVGRESEVKHNVKMLQHDSKNSDKTAPQPLSVQEKDLHKYVLISEEKMNQGVQSVRLPQEKPKKAWYNENTHYSGSQSPLLLAEIKTTLGLEQAPPQG